MARIPVGNQTAFFAPPLLPFEFAVEQGFDAFEFFPDGRPAGPGWETADLSPETRARIRATARACRIRLSVHAALAASPLGREGRARLFEEMDFARDVGARVFNIHWVPGDCEAFALAVVALVPALVAADLVLSIENTPAAAPEDFNALFARLQTLDPSAVLSVGMCLDIGHANLHVSTRNDYLAYLHRLSGQVPVVHGHLHENRGDSDSHLTLFTGPAGKDPAGVEALVHHLIDRGYAGSLILEQWPNPPGLLATARDRLRSIMDGAASRC
jgi:sugar phosphate isomerase/epimerase